ncbi:hypothetical protein UFOVP67_42 [uncultured Caudovirales phage]|uniref:Uncharacterized protein n=1 Tax=uncultured Caudovirales phage TaxID=2100421 RepID=A0A6J5T8X1_9CAUD|nr:hypothetical protein UFOVP67_42 [uncultured Caudovirales phage]
MLYRGYEILKVGTKYHIFAHGGVQLLLKRLCARADSETEACAWVDYKYDSEDSAKLVNSLLENIESRVYYDCEGYYNRGVIENTEAESTANRKLLSAILKVLTEEQLKGVLNNV